MPRSSRTDVRLRDGPPRTSPPLPSDSGSTARNRHARSMASNTALAFLDAKPRERRARVDFT